MAQRLILSSLVCLTALAGCASRSDRIASALMDYGVPRQPAKCVARELDERLSNKQLRAISTAFDQARKAGSSDRPGQRIGEALDALRDVGDREVVTVAMRAGVACSLMG